MGLFPAESVAALEKMGDWMTKNSAAIYGSKSWAHQSEGEAVRFTEGADGAVYVFLRKGAWDGTTVFEKKIIVEKGNKITVLGENKPLSWKMTAKGLFISLKKKPAEGDILVLKINGSPAILTAPPTILDGKTVHVFSKKTVVEIKSNAPGQVVRFTLDGSEPDEMSAVYARPIELSATTILKARAHEPGKTSSETASAHFIRAEYAIELGAPPAPQYAADGPQTLIDGQRGTVDFKKGGWLGFSGKDAVATLDFGEARQFQKLRVEFLRRQAAWIFLPKAIEWEASDDGQNWHGLDRHLIGDPVDGPSDTHWHYEIELEEKAVARFVRMTAQSVGRCPPWHPGAGGEAWIFMDEITVE